MSHGYTKRKKSQRGINEKMPRYHIGANSFCLNVLVFSINVACNSENLYYREQR